MPQKTHTMHGRDHCPTGADPIPCLDWLTGPGGAPVDYGAYLLSLGPIGYWRLGETGTPWEDTSGYNHDATIPGYNAGGSALTPDVTGGLPVASDDGAVRFNYTGASSGGGQSLHAAASPTSFFQVANVTYSAFVKIDGVGSSTRGQIVGSQAWGVAGGGFRFGAALQVMQPSLYVRFSLGGDGPGGGGFERYAQSPGPLLEDTWYHVAGTYDGAEIKLYLNGTLVATTADALGTGLGLGTTDGVEIGYSTGNFEHFYLAGTVDEAAVWDRALTGSEVAGLGVTETGAEAGQVLTADGDGGSSWEYPTIEVDY